MSSMGQDTTDGGLWMWILDRGGIRRSVKPHLGAEKRLLPGPGGQLVMVAKPVPLCSDCHAVVENEEKKAKTSRLIIASSGPVLKH